MTEDLISAINGLASLIEAEAIPESQQRRDYALRNEAARMIRVLRSRWIKQKAAVLRSGGLKQASAKLTEAEETEEQKRARLVGLAIAAVSPGVMLEPVKELQASTFDKSITNAIRAGAVEASVQMETAAGATESFEAEYLRSDGFTRLTGDLDQTSVKRLANAVADAWEAGDGYAGAVAAVKSTFADFSASRADMIAQTELNDAYSQAVVEFGRQAGAQFKSWQVDVDPCLICVDNALAGKIPIDSDFPSGADAPPEHPRCRCDLLVHA